MPLRKLLLPAALLPAALSAQTLFTANFGAGEFNPAVYDIGLDWTLASTKTATGSMGAGGLAFNIASTSSGLAEVQSVVLAAPASLAVAGDALHLTITFVNTSNMMSAGASSVNIGLFNSGGSAPFTGLANSGLSNTLTSFVTGGAQSWQGYVLRFMNSGTNGNAIFTRAAQTDTVNENQDLLFSDVGNGAYDTPVGVTLGANNATGLALTTGGTYTIDLGITLAGNGSQSLFGALYSGSDTSGALLASVTGSIATPLTNAFDAVSVGFRDADLSIPAANTMTVTGVSLSAVPEPSTYAALLGGATLAVVALRRRRKS